MVSESQEYTTQATFFEVQAKSQPKKHDEISREISSCFFNKAKMRQNPRLRRAQHLEECEILAQDGVFEVREKQQKWNQRLPHLQAKLLGSHIYVN